MHKSGRGRADGRLRVSCRARQCNRRVSGTANDFDGRRSRSCERRVVWHFRCRHSRDTRGRLPRRRRGQWRDGSCTRLVGKLDDVGRLGASRIADDVLRMGTIGVGSSVRIQCRRVRVAYRRFGSECCRSSVSVQCTLFIKLHARTNMPDASVVVGHGHSDQVRMPIHGQLYRCAVYSM
jgi:hypothetical protein